MDQRDRAVQHFRLSTLAACGLGVILTASGCQSKTDDNANSSLPITESIGVTDDFRASENPAPVVTPMRPDEAASSGAESPGSIRVDPTVLVAENTPMITPGITNPVMYPADEVNIPEEAMIIGFVIDGQPRAFLQSAMSTLATHVVNDVVGSTPVSVTFCDRSDCVRVFSSDKDSKPIDLQTGGYSGDDMVIMLNGQAYPHSSGTIPLQDVDFVRTAWIAWKLEHPDTTVFVGSEKGALATESPESSVSPTAPSP